MARVCRSQRRDIRHVCRSGNLIFARGRWVTEIICKNPTYSSLRQPQGQMMDEGCRHPKLPASPVSGVVWDREGGRKEQIICRKRRREDMGRDPPFFHRFLKTWNIGATWPFQLLYTTSLYQLHPGPSSLHWQEWCSQYIKTKNEVTAFIFSLFLAFFFLMLHTRMPLIWCCHEVITLGITYALADSTTPDYHIIKRRIPPEWRLAATSQNTHTAGGIEGLPIMGHAHLRFASEQDKQVMQPEKKQNSEGMNEASETLRSLCCLPVALRFLCWQCSHYIGWRPWGWSIPRYRELNPRTCWLTAISQHHGFTPHQWLARATEPSTKLNRSLYITLIQELFICEL